MNEKKSLNADQGGAKRLFRECGCKYSKKTLLRKMFNLNNVRAYVQRHN